MAAPSRVPTVGAGVRAPAASRRPTRHRPLGPVAQLLAGARRRRQLGVDHEALGGAADRVAGEDREGPARVLVDDPERGVRDDLDARHVVVVRAGRVRQHDVVAGRELGVAEERLGVAWCGGRRARRCPRTPNAAVPGQCAGPASMTICSTPSRTGWSSAGLRDLDAADLDERPGAAGFGSAAGTGQRRRRRRAAAAGSAASAAAVASAGSTAGRRPATGLVDRRRPGAAATARPVDPGRRDRHDDSALVTPSATKRPTSERGGGTDHERSSADPMDMGSADRGRPVASARSPSGIDTAPEPVVDRGRATPRRAGTAPRSGRRRAELAAAVADPPRRRGSGPRPSARSSATARAADARRAWSRGACDPEPAVRRRAAELAPAVGAAAGRRRSWRSSPTPTRSCARPRAGPLGEVGWTGRTRARVVGALAAAAGAPRPARPRGRGRRARRARRRPRAARRPRRVRGPARRSGAGPCSRSRRSTAPRSRPRSPPRSTTPTGRSARPPRTSP